MAQRIMSKAGGRFFGSNNAFTLSVWCFFSFLVGAAVAGEAISASSTVPQDATGVVDLKALQERLGHPKPITWVFTGDSITHGAVHTKTGFRSYPELFAERVRWEMRRFRDVVINTGISGHTTEHLMADWEWRVERFKPDVVSIMMGMNDATGGSAGREKFRDNLRGMVKKARTSNAIPILNTPNPISLTSPDPRRTDLPAYAQIILEVAKELDCVCVDHYNHWLKTRPQASELAKWLNDPIHPGVTGHREMSGRSSARWASLTRKAPRANWSDNHDDADTVHGRVQGSVLKGRKFLSPVHRPGVDEQNKNIQPNVSNVNQDLTREGVL